MCLTLGPFAYKHKAKKDIFVYKYLIKNGDDLYTPFRGIPIEIGETYFSRIARIGFSVENGLHAFLKINACKKSIITFRAHRPVIVECVIPKGSNYYKGSFNSRVSFASNELKYLKIVG